MNRDLFIRAGRCLYGPDPLWHEPLSIDLAVALRTLQRWANGQREIPELQGELAALCHERSRELAWLAEQLANSPESAPTDSGSAG